MGREVAEADREGRTLFANGFADSQPSSSDQVFEFLARRRRLQIFDDRRLDARVANESQRVARRAARGIVIDGNGH